MFRRSIIIPFMLLLVLLYGSFEIMRSPNKNINTVLEQAKRDISDNFLIAKNNLDKKTDDHHYQPPQLPKVPKTPQLDPCTVINPLSNGFFDLRELSGSIDGSVMSWNARGWDYGMNFTLGICSTPLKKLQLTPDDFSDVLNSSIVGAYYTDVNNLKYSIGEFSTAPVFRGRKLTLTYENGSFCKISRNGELLRKSTILSFSCDRQIMSKAQVSFVGVLHDCDYFFEVKTVHACATALKSDNLALVWIFALIFLLLLFVFCGAGTLYRRFGRRGWRPLPSTGILSNIKSIVSRQYRPVNLNRSQDNNIDEYLDVLDLETDSDNV